jgi:exo-1,4-beta-D-glucosaminidase
VNSTYRRASGLHATVQVHGIAWNELYITQVNIDAEPDSTQRVFTLPDSLYASAERIFFIDLTLADDSGRVLSRNFYWVPDTLTTFDWPKTWYTYTPAERYEDLSALAHLPAATVAATAEIANTTRGRELRVKLDNSSAALAFQLHAAVRTPAGELIAPVLWSDNWIELAPGESTTLTALLPGGSGLSPVVEIEGWNISRRTVIPGALHAEK